MRTASGATALQVVYSSQRGSREIEHLDSAHDEAEPEALKAAAQQRVAAAQDVLAVGGGLRRRAGRAAADHGVADELPAASLLHAYWTLDLDRAAGGDGVLEQLVIARVVEPVSKLDSLRVLEETGVAAACYRTRAAAAARVCAG